MNLCDPQLLHKQCMQSATKAIEGTAVPANVEAALAGYAASMRVSPQAVRREELKLDRAIAKDLETLGGWDNANAVRDAYKASLDALMSQALDQAHTRGLEAAQAEMAKELPDKLIPPDMVFALKNLAKAQLFPGKFEDLAAKSKLRDALQKSEAAFVLPADDGRETLAYLRSSKTQSSYKRALAEIVKAGREQTTAGL